MNRYIDSLSETAQQMTVLADRLGKQKAQPLKAGEKELIRLAMLPTARGLLQEALFEFTIGKEAGISAGLTQFAEMAKDLKE